MQDLPEWIDAYLDDMLSDEQHHLLSEWIQADPEHALQFARMHMLHDRLRNVLTLGPASFMTDQFVAIRPTAKNWRTSWWTTSFARNTAIAAVLIVGMGLIWFSMAVPNASAAIRELDRIIVSSTIAQDRTYEIVVEDISAGLKEKRSSNPERRRPPKRR